jgi:hypothetical protein
MVGSFRLGLILGKNVMKSAKFDKFIKESSKGAMKSPIVSQTQRNGPKILLTLDIPW